MSRWQQPTTDTNVRIHGSEHDRNQRRRRRDPCNSPGTAAGPTVTLTGAHNQTARVLPATVAPADALIDVLTVELVTMDTHTPPTGGEDSDIRHVDADPSSGVPSRTAVFRGLPSRVWVYARTCATDTKRRKADFSAWTDGGQTGPSSPAVPRNVVLSTPVPRRLVTKWDDPTTLDGVVKYKVETVAKVSGSYVSRDTSYVDSNYFRYAVEDRDIGRTHRVKVSSVDDLGNESAQVIASVDEHRSYAGSLGVLAIDAVTDDGPAMQAEIDEAIANVGSSYGGVLEVDSGTIAIGDTLILGTDVAGIGGGHGVVFQGRGRAVTTIKALSSFPPGKPLIQIGTDSTLAFGHRVESMTLDCAGVLGSVGVYSASGQEQSGVRYVAVVGYMAAGIEYEKLSSSANFNNPYVMDSIECNAGADYGQRGFEASDGTTAASDATFTSPTANFVATDVGMPIIIRAAGGDANTPLITRIASVTNATTVELLDAASSTIAGTAKFVFGTFGIYMHALSGTHGGHISGVTVSGNASDPTGYGVVLENASNVYMRNIHVEKNHTGVLAGFGSTALGLALDEMHGMSNLTTCVHIADNSSAGTMGISLRQISKNGATNAIVDEILGQTITDSQVTEYVVGTLNSSNHRAALVTGSSTPWSLPSALSLPRRTVTNADATVGEGDFYLDFTTGATDRVCTLPSMAANLQMDGRTYSVSKNDVDSGIVTVKKHSDDGGSTVRVLGHRYDSVLVHADRGFGGWRALPPEPAPYVIDPARSNESLLAWTYEPSSVSINRTPLGASIYLLKIMVPQTLPIANLLTLVITAGTSYTNTQLGVYSPAGVLLGSSAVMASAGTDTLGTTGLKSIPITAEAGQSLTIAGSATSFFWAGVHMGTNAATAVILGGGSSNVPVLNAGISAAALLRACKQTGHATNSLSTIGNLTPSSNSTTTPLNIWVGVT